jgi:hypothetical protein
MQVFVKLVKRQSILVGCAALVMLCLSVPGNAAPIKITGTSSVHGQLGWFIVEDTIFNTDTSLAASQFLDFYFADPLGSAVINPGNVPFDTGVTHFGFVSGAWTVTGGSGDSLTASNGDIVWIAGTSFVVVGNFGNHQFNDVSWSTGPANVPEPASLTLAAIGLLGMLGLRRRRRIE